MTARVEPWDSAVCDMLARFAACPVVADNRHQRFVIYWNAVSKSVKTRRGARVRADRIAPRVAESVCALGQHSVQHKEQLVQRLRGVLERGYEEIWARVVRERCGSMSNPPKELLDAFDEEGITLYGLDDSVKDSGDAAHTNKNGRKRKKRARTTMPQTCAKYNARTFCLALLAVYTCWSDLVVSSSEIPPTMLTAAVRLGCTPQRFFRNWRYGTSDQDATLWVEHAISVGLYRLALRDCLGATSERDTAAMPHKAASNGCKTSGSNTPARDEAADGSEHTTSEDEVGDVASPEALGDDVFERIMQWHKAQHSAGEDATTLHDTDYQPRSLCLVGEGEELMTRCDEGDMGQDGNHGETLNAVGTCLVDTSTACDEDSSVSASSHASTYVSTFRRNDKLLQASTLLGSCKASVRAQAVVAADPYGASNRWQMLPHHPYTVSMAVFAVCAAFCAETWLSNNADQAPEHHCALCRVRHNGMNTTGIDNEGDESAFGAMFWYYRIHWLSTVPQTTCSDEQTRKHSVVARQVQETLALHQQGAHRCESCRFVVSMVGVLSRYAVRESALMTAVDAGGDVVGDACGIALKKRVDLGLQFFEHAHTVMQVKHNDRTLHYGIAVERGWDSPESEPGHGSVVVDEVPEALREDLLTKSEQQSADEFCTVSMPSAFGTLLTSSIGHFTMDPTRGTNGVMNTTTSDGGQTLVACLHREDLHTMQCAVGPLVALDKRCYMDTDSLRRCSGSIAALRNMLCGTPHELYYAMQWLRRCLFRRSTSGTEHMLAPTSNVVTMYRMLPRLLSSLSERDMTKSLVAPYNTRGSLGMQTGMQRKRTEKLCGVELFYSDTVDLQRVTRNMRDDMFLRRRDPIQARIIPRRYDLRFVRDRHDAMRKIRTQRGRQQKMLRLFVTHARELRSRVDVLHHISEFIRASEALYRRDSAKPDPQVVYSAQIERLNARQQRKAAQHGVTGRSSARSIAVAAMLGSFDRAQSDDGSANDGEVHCMLEEPLKLHSKRKLTFTGAPRGVQMSLYASLHAFLVPVNARVCASSLMLGQVWRMLASYPSMWNEYRLLAALLMEMMLSTHAEREKLQQRAAKDARRNLGSTAWIDWVITRRKYVYDRLRSTCFTGEKKNAEGKHGRRRGAKADVDNGGWVSIDAEHEDEDGGGGGDDSGGGKKGRRVQARRGVRLVKQWCTCLLCAKVSTSAHGSASRGPHRSKTTLAFQPVPPRPGKSMQEYADGFHECASASEQRCKLIPEMHAIIPQKVACFPDIAVPTHYLLYEFAVDARVNCELREMIFLGIKALPFSGRMECVSENTDGDAMRFREANAALETWIAETVVRRSDVVADNPDAFYGGPTLESLCDSGVSLAHYDTIMKRFGFGVEDVALMMQANCRNKRFAVWPPESVVVQARRALQLTETRHKMYSDWLGNVLVEWEWNRARYPALKGRYGAMVLNAGNAIPVKSLYHALFSAELLTRLEFRTLHGKSQTHADTLAYDEKRRALYSSYCSILDRKDMLMRQLEESCNGNEQHMKSGQVELERVVEKRLGDACEHVMKTPVCTSTLSGRHLLMDRTMREDVTDEMIHEYMPSDVHQIRALLTLCANDVYLMPPYLVERRDVWGVWGTDNEQTIQQQLSAVHPLRCVPVSYSEHVNRTLLLRRPVNKALQGLAPSPLAATNSLHYMSRELRDETRISETQRLMRRIRHTVQTLVFHSRALQPQLLSCLYALPFRTISGAAMRCDHMLRQTKASYTHAHTPLDDRCMTEPDEHRTPYSESGDESPGGIYSDSSVSPFAMEDALNARIDRLHPVIMQKMSDPKVIHHTQHNINRTWAMQSR